jgi:hypothetical protein
MSIQASAKRAAKAHKEIIAAKAPFIDHPAKGLKVWMPPPATIPFHHEAKAQRKLNKNSSKLATTAGEVVLDNVLNIYDLLKLGPAVGQKGGHHS